MDNKELIIQDICKEIYDRYPIKEFGEAEYFFYEALKDEGVQEKICETVHEIVFKNM